jgi:hypothetical protein
MLLPVANRRSMLSNRRANSLLRNSSSLDPLCRSISVLICILSANLKPNAPAPLFDCLDVNGHVQKLGTPAFLALGASQFSSNFGLISLPHLVSTSGVRKSIWRTASLRLTKTFSSTVQHQQLRRPDRDLNLPQSSPDPAISSPSCHSLSTAPSRRRSWLLK